MHADQQRKNRNRTLKIEPLERRELMAGDVTAAVVAGVLHVTGTAGNDNVVVRFDGSGRAKVFNGTKQIPFREEARPNAFHSVRANLGTGTDLFKLESSVPVHSRPGASPPVRLETVRIELGAGDARNRRDGVVLRSIVVRQLQIESANSMGANVDIGNVHVTDTLFARFGAGSDHLGIHSGSLVNRLDAGFGRGNDTFILNGGAGSSDGRQFYNQVNSAKVDMGSGNDTATVGRNSNILSGTIDGGLEKDKFRKDGARLLATVRGFEA